MRLRAISLNDEMLVHCSYELGTGPANITSAVRVDDGRPHEITAIRYSRHHY